MQTVVLRLVLAVAIVLSGAILVAKMPTAWTDPPPPPRSRASGKLRLYSRKDCPHCRAQIAILGPERLARIEVVDCGGAGGAACSARGVSSVPQFELDGALLAPGYTPLRRVDEMLLLSAA